MAHRWNCILYKWQGGGVEWQHGVTITKVVALVMHYGDKGGTGWQPGLGNKCGTVWYNAPGVAVAVSRVVAEAVAGCNLHQTKRRQSCPGWEVDEPCLPQTHIPQLFLLLIIIIIAVFVEHFPQTLIIVEHFPKTLKKKEG